MRNYSYLAIPIAAISLCATAATAQDTLAELASATSLEPIHKRETPPALSNVILQNNKIVFENVKVAIGTRYQGKLKTHPQADDDFFSSAMDGADIYSVTNTDDKGLEKLGSRQIQSIAMDRQLNAHGATTLALCLSEYQDLNNYNYKSGKFTSCTTYSLSQRP